VICPPVWETNICVSNPSMQMAISLRNTMSKQFGNMSRLIDNRETMKPFPTPTQCLRPLWLLLTGVAFACTCNLSQLLAPPVSPTPPQQSPYPTYTPYPTFTLLPAATIPPALPSPTSTPPAKQPTATLTEQPPPPGGGSWGVTTADLAVNDLFPDTWPQGRIFIRITNNGPDTLTNIPTNQLSCTTGTHPYDFSPPSAEGSSWPLTISLVPGQTEAYDTGITVNGNINWYNVTCSIQANFNDPTPSNDSYSETFPPPP